MKPNEMVIGFSDIKSEFRTRLNLAKSMTELAIWFSLKEGVLYVHDKDNHSSCSAISIKSGNVWNIRLDRKKFGYPLILELAKQVPEAELAEYLNKLFDEYGYQN